MLAYMTEVTRSTSAMVREPTSIHSGTDDPASSIDSKTMPDLSETKLRKNRSPASNMAHSHSSGDEGSTELEDKNHAVDSAEEEVSEL